MEQKTQISKSHNIINSNYYAVLMAGGSGKRLWPMSRISRPKQFHALTGEKTLLQETYLRLKRVLNPSQIFVATAAVYKDEVIKQLAELPESQFIIEPTSKNTAPAIGFVATKILMRNPKAIITTIASDHVIQNPEEFAAALKAAFKATSLNPNHLITIGINPRRPETGLGYIKMGKQLKESDGHQLFQVDTFVEKPDLPTAQQYIKSWRYLWNACYYCFRASDCLAWFGKYQPRMKQLLDKIKQELTQKEPQNKKIAELFARFESEQFEIAIIQKKGFVKNVFVIPSDLEWSDVGNWASVHDILSETFKSGMIIKGHHIDHGSQNCLIYAHDKLVATLGLKDVIIVDSPDVTLVAAKDKAQELKQLLDKIKEQGKYLYL
ncbi:MAG: mannose-1-phosphate guanylyltransferase [Candidatus Nealsonbacteria bacterium CG10_big_fil_rev_8_21_14_0_10_40_24]|nr:MAG: mannose-1-phosphate guanylyltransferase [Candidatus Nealsonbacteria bacterium CG10_big_fil_rev_8_21_14_0_10_40_24]